MANGDKLIVFSCGHHHYTHSHSVKVGSWKRCKACGRLVWRKVIKVENG